MFVMFRNVKLFIGLVSLNQIRNGSFFFTAIINLLNQSVPLAFYYIKLWTE